MRTLALLALAACGGSNAKPKPDAPDASVPQVAITGMTVNGNACAATAGCDCSAVAGDTIDFHVIASDDDGVALVTYNAAIAGMSLTGTTMTADASVDVPFSFAVPAGAGTETAILAADAADPAGNTGSAPHVQLCISPAKAPRAPVLAWEEQVTGQSQVYVRQWDGTTWAELGGSASLGGISNAATGNAETPAVALMPDGKPVVAWIDHPPAGTPEDVYLRRWNGTTWEELGGSATGGGVSQSPSGNIGAQDVSIAVDSAGRVYVAWKFGETPGNVCCNLWIYVKRWNGTAWEELAGSASSTGINAASDGSAPQIRIDGSDRPVVAWNQEISSGCWIWLRRWNGTAWEELASSASSTGVGGTNGAADPALAIDHDGNPFVAWALDSGTTFDAVQFTGSAWSAVGGYSPGACVAGLGYTATVDATNAPLVAAWPLGGGASNVYRWNGTAWDGLSLAGATTRVSIDADATGVLAAYTNASNQIAVQRWDGTSWQAFGNTYGGMSFQPVVATH